MPWVCCRLEGVKPNSSWLQQSESSQHTGAARPCGRAVIFYPEPWVRQEGPSDRDREDADTQAVLLAPVYGQMHWRGRGLLELMVPNTSWAAGWHLFVPLWGWPADVSSESSLCALQSGSVASAVPQAGWRGWSLQRNMLRQAQPGWPHIKSILGWKQIKS